MQSDYWTVLFRQDDITGKTAMRLCPDGSLTRRAVYAAMIPSRDKANEIAAKIREDFPDATVKVRKF